MEVCWPGCEACPNAGALDAGFEPNALWPKAGAAVLVDPKGDGRLPPKADVCPNALPLPACEAWPKVEPPGLAA